MRHHRAISLRTDPLILPDVTVAFEECNTSEYTNYRIQTRRWREDNVLHCETTKVTQQDTAFGEIQYAQTTKWSRPCFIDYNEIVAACKVEVDNDDSRTPWEDCDGWEHAVKTESDFESDFWNRTNNNGNYDSDMFADQRGFVHNCDSRLRGVIVIDDRYGNGQAVYDNARHKGASKQVAAEMLAQWKRRYVDQLVDWYKNGWTWYCVDCKFDTGTDAYEESIGGVDDEEYAKKHLIHEITSQIAGSLAKDGYVVINEPNPRKDYNANRLAEYRRCMNQFNWD